MFQRPLTLILLQKYRDTNGSRIVIQIGGVYTNFCQKKGILLQKYRDRNGRCIAILFRSIRVRGRFDSPEPNPEFWVINCVVFGFCLLSELVLGTEKVPQRNCVAKILPNVRVNFLVRFASKPSFCWVMTGNPLELFRKFFGAVRAIFWLCGSFLARDCKQNRLNPTLIELLRFTKHLSWFLRFRRFENPLPFPMRLFCLQLEASCLQWSFSTYSWQL